MFNKPFNISYGGIDVQFSIDNYYFEIYSLHEKERLNNKDQGYVAIVLCFIQRNRNDLFE
jgi:hypothetical protein